MEEISVPSSSIGGRTIDRHNPIIRDGGRRIGKPSPPPYNNQLIQNHDDDDEEENKNKTLVEFMNPPTTTSSSSSSSRYLLDDSGRLSDTILGHFQDPVLTQKKISASNLSPLSSSFPPSRAPDQVVVVRVSLHCRGCEGKVRKHISRMKGVTSFNIDFTEKKVTVVGDVTPLSVLATISKVKNVHIISLPPTSAPILLDGFQS